MQIRRVEKNDDPLAISNIYEKSWKFAYGGILPDSYLQDISAGKWAGHLDDESMINLVMLDDEGKYVGTASCCKSRFPEYDGMGEIVSIYFLPEYMGHGYGAELLAAAIAELLELGYKDIFLWVLEGNRRAQRFYEKNGFKPSGKYMDDNIGGADIRELQYCIKG